MKKVLAILCALTMIFALCACGESAAPAAAPESAAAPASAAASDGVAHIGVCQLVQHPALDKATEGFVTALKDKFGDQVAVDIQNASGDSATCATIVNTFVSDEVDLIMANATPALQAAQAATNAIPILGTSITDYGVALGLDDFNGKTTGINVSGSSDLAPMDGQAEVLHELFPDAATVGILYCSAEANSKYQVEAITPLLEGMGYTVNAYTFADSNDVAAVTATACDENDVLYIPTDNTAANCAEAINNVALPAGKPIICGEENLCAGCGVATLSISYFDIGYEAGLMAYEILVNGADVSSMEIEYAVEITKEYNAANCEALGITVPEGYVAIGG